LIAIVPCFGAILNATAVRNCATAPIEVKKAAVHPFSQLVVYRSIDSRQRIPCADNVLVGFDPMVMTRRSVVKAGAGS